MSNNIINKSDLMRKYGDDTKENEFTISGYLISKKDLLDKLRGNVLVDVTPELEKAVEEQTAILELPCQIGDTVYTNLRMAGWHLRDKDRPYKVKVVFIGINGRDNFFNVEYENGTMFQFKFSDFGKCVYHTEEEARENLKNMV